MATTETQPQTHIPAAPAKPSYRIKSISVSLELADKNYGTGMANYTNIQACVDDASLDQINDVVDAGLMLYVAAWRTLIAGQLVTNLGTMGPHDVREVMGKINSRLGKVKALVARGERRMKFGQCRSLRPSTTSWRTGPVGSRPVHEVATNYTAKAGLEN